MEENLGPKELDAPDKEDENRGLREGDALLQNVVIQKVINSLDIDKFAQLEIK